MYTTRDLLGLEFNIIKNPPLNFKLQRGGKSVDSLDTPYNLNFLT